VTERSGGGETRLARIDVSSVFGRQTRQVQDLGLATSCAFDRLTRDLHQAPALRYFPRTGMVAAGRAIHDQNARQAGRIVVALLGRRDRGAGFQPVDREIVAGIREVGPGLAGMGGLAAGPIGVPRDRLDLVDLRAQPPKGRIGEAAQVAATEFLPRQARIGHPAPRLDVVLVLG